MSADAVPTALGKPDEVKPIANGHAGAEVWIYRREFEERAGQIPDKSEQCVMYNGPSQSDVVSASTTYRDQYRRVQETTLVMVFQGSVVECDRTRKAGPVY